MENSSSEQPVPGWMKLPSWLLSQTAAHSHRLLTEAFSSVGARGYHYRLLATLEEFGPASQAELGRRSGIHLSDMVATLNELAEESFIERTPDPSDRRRNVISLTAAGKRRLRVLGERLAESQDELLAPLSLADRRKLTGLLTRLQAHHDQRAGESESPWR